MQFELTESLIGDILFFMEDQNGDFYIDAVEGIVVGGIEGLDFYLDENPEIDREDTSRFFDLPAWNSSDGFELMEQFASRIRDPIIRNELKGSLNHGRGVFRAFKNALGNHPETEKQWYAYKEKKMKEEILFWYNSLREEWGLERIGGEPEETEDLVLEDFRFRLFLDEDWEKAMELHNSCLEETKSVLADKGLRSLTEKIVRESPVFLPIKEGSSLYAMLGETAEGDFASYIAGILENTVLTIYSLEVKEEYRGLGIGETLLKKFLDDFSAKDVSQVFLDLPSWAEGFSRVLLRESFHPYMVKYRLDLRERSN